MAVLPPGVTAEYVSCHRLSCWPEDLEPLGELVTNIGGPHGTLTIEPPLVRQLYTLFDHTADLASLCPEWSDGAGVVYAQHDPALGPLLIESEPGLGALLVHFFPLGPAPTTLTLVTTDGALSVLLLPEQGPVAVALYSDLAEAVAQFEVHADQPYAIGGLRSAPRPTLPCSERSTRAVWETYLGVRLTGQTTDLIANIAVNPVNELDFDVWEPEAGGELMLSLEAPVQAVRLEGEFWFNPGSEPFHADPLAYPAFRFAGVAPTPLDDLSDDPVIEAIVEATPLLDAWRVQARVASGAALRAIVYHDGALAGRAFGLGAEIAQTTAIPHQVQTGSFDQVPDVTLWWRSPVQLMLADGQVLYGDELRVISEDPLLTVPGYTALRIQAFEIPRMRFTDAQITPMRFPGDTNCDGQVDFNDIDPFVLALISRASYQERYPNCNYDNADCNGDGSVDFNDIDAFVQRLIGR